MTATVQRKLAAILAADAVGYSRLMAQDEEATVRVLSAHRAVIDGIIEFHHGRIVGTAGDSVLAEFASPVEALRCAVEIQAALETRNASLAEDSRMRFRIGINLGDVMVKGNDLLGDGVNVAARLEGIAAPGGICISSSVYDQIAGKLDLGFVEMGEKSLKNIDRPVRVYSVKASGPPGLTRARRAPRRLPYLAGAAIALVALAGGWWRFLGPGGEPPAPAVVRTQAVAQAVPVAAGTSATGAREAEHNAAAARYEAERKIATERADTERKVQEARIAALQAKADEAIAKARADAEIAEARADAEALRRQAEAELAAARKAPVVADVSRAMPSEPSATPAVALAAAASAAKPQSPSTSNAVSEPTTAPKPQWTATLHCDAFRGSDEIFNEVKVHVEQGAFMIVRRPEGVGGHLVLHGVPGKDGVLVLTGTVLAPRGRQRGEALPVRLEGSLDGVRYVTRGTLGERPCEVDIAQR